MVRPYSLRAALRRRAAALAVVGLGLGVLGPARADLPDLGEAADAAVTPQAERHIGEQTVAQLRAAGAYFDDPEVNAYLDSIGQRLVARIADSHPDFRFFAVGSPEINAFALPGGFIGVNTGLILATRSESELASVLAHEITHVTQRHIARQMASNSHSQLLMLGSLAAALVAGRAGGGNLAMATIATSSAVQAQTQINYTREHEREADRIGFTLLQEAGFDSRGMAVFFERMQQAVRTKESDTPAYLRTHPMTQERIAEAQAREERTPFHQVADSADFRFVRALLQSYEGEPEEAVKDFTTRLAEKRYPDRNAARYGLAASWLRAKDFGHALAEIRGLDRDGVRHPMIDSLAGQILQQSGKNAAAIARYEAALGRFPSHLQLVYDYPRALLAGNRAADVVHFVGPALDAHPGDPVLHQLAAEAYAALGDPMRSHRHQGEFYAALGDTRGAIEQLELAVRADNGDTRELLEIESRLKILRASRQDADRRSRTG